MNVAVSVDCAIFGFENNKLKVLLIKSDLDLYRNRWSLLGDMVRPEEDINSAVSRIVKSRTGLTDVYMEQVHTFGKVNRHPEGRVITIVYCSLINIKHHELKILDNELHWHDLMLLKKCLRSQGNPVRLPYLASAAHAGTPLRSHLLEKEFSLRDLQLLYETILERKWIVAISVKIFQYGPVGGYR